MEKIDILSAFNNHIIDFFDDILLLFPEDNDLMVAQASLVAIRKLNPKLIYLMKHLMKSLYVKRLIKEQ